MAIILLFGEQCEEFANSVSCPTLALAPMSVDVTMVSHRCQDPYLFLMQTYSYTEPRFGIRRLRANFRSFGLGCLPVVSMSHSCLKNSLKLLVGGDLYNASEYHGSGNTPLQQETFGTLGGSRLTRKLPLFSVMCTGSKLRKK